MRDYLSSGGASKPHRSKYILVAPAIFSRVFPALLICCRMHPDHSLLIPSWPIEAIRRSPVYSGTLYLALPNGVVRCVMIPPRCDDDQSKAFLLRLTDGWYESRGALQITRILRRTYPILAPFLSDNGEVVYTYLQKKLTPGFEAMEAQSFTLQAAFLAYHKEYLPSLNRSEHTRRCYTMDLTQLLRFLEQLNIMLVSQLELRHLELFLADLDAKGLAGSTRARKAASIKSFVAFLSKRNYLTSSLATELVAPKRESPTPRFLSEKEYQRLQLTVAHQPRDAAMIELLLQTGIRLSELANITIKDVEIPTKITKEPDNVGSLLICKGKGRKDRLITLNYKACRALKAYLQVRPRETGYEQLFLSKFRKPMSHRGIEWVVNKHLDEASIERAHVHSLRHTFGTHAVKKGWNLRAVQEMMGHKDLATTSLYVSLAREQMNADAQQRPL